MLRKKTAQFLFLVLGWASFVVGIIGIFLPILPTTPFILLSAYCFDKGSPKLHAWILGLPKIGKIIHDWNEKKIITTHIKILSISMMAIGMATMWWKAPEYLLPVKIAVLLVMIYIAFFILKQKSK